MALCFLTLVNSAMYSQINFYQIVNTTYPTELTTIDSLGKSVVKLVSWPWSFVESFLYSILDFCGEEYL